MDIKTKRVLIFDLDGTLIKTESGKTFSEDISDMKFRREVINRIKGISSAVPIYVAIVTNQGGIDSGYVNGQRFLAKLAYISASIEDICGTNVEVHTYLCGSNDAACNNRKPNTGMFLELKEDLEYLDYRWKEKDMLMIGDASGKKGNFSDSDLRFAENCNVDYMDVEDFINKL